jgi:hypothetical protein
VQDKPGVSNLRISQKVVDARGIQCRRAADDTMDFIALTEEQFGQVTAVLTRNSRDERFFHRIAIPSQCVLLS